MSNRNMTKKTSYKAIVRARPMIQLIKSFSLRNLTSKYTTLIQKFKM